MNEEEFRHLIVNEPTIFAWDCGGKWLRLVHTLPGVGHLVYVGSAEVDPETSDKASYAHVSGLPLPEGFKVINDQIADELWKAAKAMFPDSFTGSPNQIRKIVEGMLRD